jgi:TolB-like protein
MKKLLLALLATAALAGCASAPASGPLPAPVGSSNPTVVRTNEAADYFARVLQSAKPTTPLVVASLVSVDDLSQSSSFGRMVGEQIAARLAERGVPVVELKLRNSLFMSRAGGEFMLSREVKDLTLDHKAEVVLVGTYSVMGSDVLVTLKAVDVRDNTIVTGHSYTVSYNAVRFMLEPPGTRR